MIIPRSQGQKSSSPTLQQHTPLTGLSSIGKAVQQVVDHHKDIKVQEAKVQVDDVLTSEMSEQVTLVKNDVANGVYDAEQGKQRLEQWSQQRFEQLKPNLPKEKEKDFASYWNSQVLRQGASLLPLQLRADEQKGKSLADQSLDIATRLDRNKGREYLQTTISGLNISEQERKDRLYRYDQTRDLMDIDSRTSAAIEERDVLGLQTLLTDLDNGGFGYLDGPTIQQKRNQVLSRIDALNKQFEVEENKRVQTAGKAFNDFKSQVLTGRALDDEYIADVGLAVAGTELESEYEFYSAQSSNFQSFSRLSTSEQEKRINEQRALSKNSKTSDAVTEEKILGVYESIYNEKRKTIQENPSQAVREAGLNVHTLSGDELKSNHSSFATKAIDNAVSQIALNDPNVKVKPIPSEDLPGAKKAFDEMNADQKLNFIGDLIQQTKGVQNGATIWGATLGQLGGNNRTYLMAGIARMNGFKSDQGEDVAAAILSGTELLKNKQIIMPKDDDLMTEFNRAVGQSVTGSDANMLYESFKSIYAHTLDRRGIQHKSKDDAPDKSAVKTALDLATGGVYTQQGKFKNYVDGKITDWKVSKPYGMPDDLFEAHITGMKRGLARAHGISESDLDSLRLRRAGTKKGTGELMYEFINERGTPLYRGVLSGVTK